ncbi:MAG: LamG domain-containing protein [Planctomycetota bacterium]
MDRRLLFVVLATLVLGVAQSASAGIINWTNDAVDNNSWCNQFNWDPNTAVPGTSDTGRIRPPGRGPIIDCDVDVGVINGPGNGQEVDIVSGTVNIVGNWDWSSAGGTATINITGSPTIEIGGNWDSPRNGTGRLNISGNPTINVTGGGAKLANDGGSWCEVNMSGGSLSITGRLMWGDDGGGEFNVSGGATVECGELDYTGQSGADWTLNLDGGTITVAGRMRIPEKTNGAGKATVNLDVGTLECGSFQHAEVAYAMDINEGMFIIDGDQVAAMNADVDANYITAFNNTVGVSVTYEGGKTIVKADYVQVKAWDPSPDDYALSECPGVELSWQAGAYAADHNVYFGSSLSDVNESADPCLEHYGSTSWTPPGLKLGTKYYWRVDEVNDACSPYVWTGDIWEFTTNDGNAFKPYPPDKETAVPRDTVLHWTPGCSAVKHEVYFSADYDEVDRRVPWASLGEIEPNTVDPCAGLLDTTTVYYWVVDENDGATTRPGPVWNFRTVSAIADPRLVLWYEFDEDEGTIVSDSSGYEHHGSANDDRWEPNEGHIGGCFDFDAGQHVLVPSSTLSSVSSKITVAVWVNGDPDQDEDDNMKVFDAGGSGYKLSGFIPTDEPELDVYWRAGNDTNDALAWESATPSAWRGEWQHFAFVKDEDVGAMKIYFNGLVAEQKTGTISSLVNVKNQLFKIGAATNSTGDYDGKVDEFRVYDVALSDNEIAGLFLGGDIELAWGPSPFHGQSDLPPDVNMSWRPGAYAEKHDVYLGIDFDDVNDANTSSVGIYRGRQDACEYEPPADLALGTTYYWRIDGVNTVDPNLWKGKIWKFTVANYIIIDDFEQYDTDTNRIYYTWFDLIGGSQIDLGTEPFSPAHGGEQSMLFIYDNATWGPGYYYSEVELPFSPAKDFTHADAIRALTLYFYGDPGNDANDTEELYVGLGGSYAEVRYSDDHGNDNNDLKLAEWTEWNIPISDFSGVDANAVTSLFIGFGARGSGSSGGQGVVFFDDIRLYPPRCRPELGPEYDFSGNCIVDWADVRIMARDWLATDIILSPITAPDPCILHYKFDETSGTTAADASGKGYTGTFFDDVDETPVDITGRSDPGLNGNSFHFTSPEYIGVKMPATVFTENGISQEITIGVWIKNAHPDEDPDGGAFMWEFREWDGVSPDANERVLAVEAADDGETYILRDSSESVSYDLDWDEHTQWQHYTFVRDANNLAIYVNGMLVAMGDSNGTPMATPDLLHVGISADRAPGNTEGMHDGFTGNMDDWKMYDYALPAAQIAYLGTDGTGYVPLLSAYDLYDGEPQGQKAINLRDLAELLRKWLEQKLWPE